MLKLQIRILLSVLLCAFSHSIKSQTTAPTQSVVHDFYANLLQGIKHTPGLAAPVTARLFAYSGLCVYEVHGIYQKEQSPLLLPGFTQLYTDKSDVPPILDGLEQVVLSTALTILTDSLVYTMQKSDRQQMYALHHAVIKMYQSESQIEAAIAVGGAVAKHIFDYSKTDGGYHAELSNYNSRFALPTTPSNWQPQERQQVVLPHWGTLRTFAPSNQKLIARLPVPFDTAVGSTFYVAAQEVAKYGSFCNIAQRETAFYWSDGFGTMTPAGHTVGIARSILIQKSAEMDEVARVYAMLGMALSDAMVTCWRAKFSENLLRPIDYIRRYIDPNWQAGFLTPAFPEFPSGHCTQAGAAEVILEAVFGKKEFFTDVTFGRKDAERNYASFEQMTEEIALARLYAGVHYRFSNDAGTQLGKSVGSAVLLLFDDAKRIAEAKDQKPFAWYDNQSRSIHVNGLQKQHLLAHISTQGGSLLGVLSENTPSLPLGETHIEHAYIIYRDESGAQVSDQSLRLLELGPTQRISVYTKSPHEKQNKQQH
jgi:PAP2 superfamily